MAFDAMKQAWADEQFRQRIEAHLKWEHDEATEREYLLRKGREEGLLQGAEQERRDLARKMLARGMDQESVLELTELRPEDLS